MRVISIQLDRDTRPQKKEGYFHGPCHLNLVCSTLAGKCLVRLSDHSFHGNSLANAHTNNMRIVTSIVTAQ
jgi:hypothetical protein